MNKSEIVKKFFPEKARDYTFFTLFFLLFSVFIIFIIKPSLTTAFSIGKEETDLKKIDSLYEKIIAGIVDTQTLLEKNRDQLYLVEKAIPVQPQVNKIAKDLEQAGTKNLILIKKLNIQEINLIEENKGFLQKVKVNIEAKSSFDNIIKFIKDLLGQRRLKSIEKLTIIKDNEAASESGQLKFSMEIEGYYL